MVEEKVDGSNFRFWVDEGKIKFGSRNVHDLDRDNQQFKEVMDYLDNKINSKVLDEDLIYVGEYMTKHSLEYNWDDIPLFIGFDVLHKDSGNPLHYRIAYDKFKELNIEFTTILFEGTVKEIEDFDYRELMDYSKYRDGKPEGIVIKNYSRLNQYERPLFAKIVNEDFQEKKKAKFGQAKINKSNTALVIEKYATEPRIRKIIKKMTVEEGQDLSRKLMSNGLYHRVINDILQENIVEIANHKKVDKLNFRQLYKLVPKKCIKVLDEVIQENAG